MTAYSIAILPGFFVPALSELGFQGNDLQQPLRESLTFDILFPPRRQYSTLLRPLLEQRSSSAPRAKARIFPGFDRLPP
jgi:hypothetical protein